MSETVLSRAKAERDALRARLSQVERFIRSYEAFEHGRVPLARDSRSARSAPRGQPALAVEAIARVLSDRALTQADIVSKLEASGFEIPSEKKKMYVNTILWRNPGRFQKNPDRTYSLAPTP